MIRVYKVRSAIILAVVIAICLIIMLIWLPQRPRSLSDIVDLTCARACVYGIEPGHTTVMDAYRQVSSITVPWQIVILADGSPIAYESLKTIKSDGKINWGRKAYMPVLEPMDSDIDYVNFETTSNGTIATIVTVRADRTYSTKLKDFVSYLGEPTHIVPFSTPLLGPNRFGTGIGAWLIYQDRGFALALTPVEVSKKRNLLNESAEVALFKSYSSDLNPRLGFNLGIAPRWTGSRDITEYCAKMPEQVDGC